MRLPTWDELIPEQLNILETPLNQSLFVAGPPGSGKTSLAVQRASMVAEVESDVRVITFNRMLRRLVALLSSNVRASTMHSFFGSDYWQRVEADAPTRFGNKYEFDWPEILGTLKGHPNCALNRGHLVVDEGQDLPVGFFQYAADHISPVLSIFADENQAVSGSQSTLEQIKHAARLPDPVLLTANHRNTPEIARVAEFFHSGRLPAAAVRRSPSGERPRLIRADSVATSKLIANMFRTRGGSIGVVTHGNDAAATTQASLAEDLPGVRIDRYTSKAKNEDSIDIRKPGITLLNVRSVKGQEFDTTFLLELEKFIPVNNDHARRVMYMLCSRARHLLLLVHGNPLSKDALDSLPPKALMERR